jgi:hypothetical protein
LEATLSIDLGTYSLEWVNDHLASTLGDRRILRDVRMLLSPVLPTAA